MAKSGAPARLKVINLFGGPGRGKSTVRAGLFWLMKTHGFSVEEVPEYAKSLVLQGNTWQLQEEQLFIFAQQHHPQLLVARNGYDYAVTDSPLHLCPFYATLAPQHAYPELEPLVDAAYARHDNFNFFLTLEALDSAEQPDAFEARGRLQSAEQASQVERALRQYLDGKGIACIDMPVDRLTPWRILEHVAPGSVCWPQWPDDEALPPGHSRRNAALQTNACKKVTQ